MVINGIDSALRTGNCLQQSLSHLTGIPIQEIPNFHRMPHNQWRQILSSWLNSRGMELVEHQGEFVKDLHIERLHIAIFRTYRKSIETWGPLHAVVRCGNDIVFNPVIKRNEDVEYRYVARILDIKPRASRAVDGAYSQ